MHRYDSASRLWLLVALWLVAALAVAVRSGSPGL